MTRCVRTDGDDCPQFCPCGFSSRPLTIAVCLPPSIAHAIRISLCGNHKVLDLVWSNCYILNPLGLPCERVLLVRIILWLF